MALATITPKYRQVAIEGSRITTDFDIQSVDHNALAKLIGLAVVSSINGARSQGIDITQCRFVVRIVA